MRLPSLVLAVTFLSAAALAQTGRDEHDASHPGHMTVAELRKEPITYFLDVPYAANENPRHRLDVYLPKKRDGGKLPVIVFFHGGGWSQGDKGDGARRLMPFVRTGQYAGISVNYRLTDEAQWPAQLHDSKAAIRWIRANAAVYGLDPERIGAWGRSAGGHLVLLLGTTGDVVELEGDLGLHKNVSSRVAGVANFFGVSELLAIVGQPTDLDRTRANAPEAKLLGGPLLANKDAATEASPITHISAGDAPVLTVHGTADRTVPYDQAVRLDTALRKAGVPSYFVAVKGAGHGNFGTAADARVKAFFDRYLIGQSHPIATTPLTEWKK